MSVSIGAFETTQLAIGDAAFIPANTTFSFWGESAYSKILYVGAGNDTVDSRIRKNAVGWTGVTWPQ